MVVATKSTVTEYADSVVSGDVLVGKLVRLACDRHLRDLETGHERGIQFDEDAAETAIVFFTFLKHSKGEWAGQSFLLAPWQQFIVGSLFGWMRMDGTRRFRTAYNEMGRKNGKSTLAAGVGLLLAFFDNEPGAEVYAAATKRDQAKIVWGEAKRMVNATAAMKQRIRVLTANLSVEAKASKFEPLGADSDSMDGLNVHGVIIDELHAHKNRDMWDVLETATGSRRQPLMFVITTAGYDRHSICWQQHQYASQVLDGVIEDDSYFAYIATVDDGDDWADETVWHKANPNLGVSVKPDDLKLKAERAEAMPAAQNAFRRLHLSQWTQQETRYIDLAKWNECGGDVDRDALTGETCYAGLDLASTTDIAALVLVFPRPDGEYEMVAEFWIPEDNLIERVRRDRVPYDVWVNQGYIQATPGNVIDYAFIRDTLNKLSTDFSIAEVAFDRWGATKLSLDLQDDGFKMVEFGQGFASMSAPTKELTNLILSKKLRHGGNPVMRWMADNLIVKQDPAGNLKPDKSKSIEKIDGMVALVMALDRAVRHGGESVYEERGILTI